MDSKRKRNNRLYDITGNPVTTFPQRHAQVSVSLDEDSLRNSCEGAASGTWMIETASVGHAHTPLQRLDLSNLIDARACCHEAYICSNCLKDATFHSDNKCIYAAGQMDLSLSAMDVFCPGWRDRWIGE